MPDGEVKYREVMEDSLLIRYLGDSPNLKIIDFLLYFPLNDFTKKEILEEVGISKQTFYEHFEQLIKTEIVLPTRKIARATLYKINKNHPIIKKLGELVREHSQKTAETELAKTRKKIPIKAR